MRVYLPGNQLADGPDRCVVFTEEFHIGMSSLENSTRVCSVDGVAPCNTFRANEIRPPAPCLPRSKPSFTCSDELGFEEDLQRRDATASSKVSVLIDLRSAIRAMDFSCLSFRLGL